MDEVVGLLPVVRRADDFADKSSGSVVEREEFPEDFGKYLQTELNWSRLVFDGGESHVAGWVFWSRRDDRPNPLPVSDMENVDVFPDSRPKVKDKIRLSLGRIILHRRYGQSLVQFWAASRTLEGRTMLSTRNQPFGLGKAGKSAWGLCEYRMKSMDYTFYGDIGEKGEEELGLPGRVFQYKLPESTPDVQYYSPKEYPQLHDASLCQVRASWALPVFEPSSQVCVGVIELVSTVDAIADWKDKSFLRNLYDVFQVLGLQLSDVHKHYEMKNGGGAMTQLDSEQPPMDAVNSGRSFIGAKRSNVDVTCSEEGCIITQERKKGKSGVKIHIPLEEIRQYSSLKLGDAAKKLKVCSATLQRVSRHYGIPRWPPRNIDNVGAPQPLHDVPPRNLDEVGVELQKGISELNSDSRPSHQASDSRGHCIHLGPPPYINKGVAPLPSHVEHQDGIPQLTSDMPSNQAPLGEEGISQLAFDRPSNQVFDSVAHVKPRDTAVQDSKTVTVRAKYVNGFTIKFQLPLWPRGPRLEELHQEVSKRLNLKAEAYDIIYEDEDGFSILMVCDEDLHLCIKTSRSLGKNLIAVLLEPKKLM